MTIGGVLDSQSYPQVLVRLQRVLAAHPVFVVLDVTGVTQVDPGGAEVFVDARSQASRWPGVPCVLVDEDAGVVAQFLSGDGKRAPPLVPSVVAALHGAEAAGSPRTTRLILPAESTSPRRARHFVADRCGEWGLDEHTWSACLVVSELVTNALLHSTGTLELALACRDGELRMAVRDGQGDLPVLLHAGLHEERGRGVTLLDSLVDDWGVLPADDGGKVVWCLLSSPPTAVPEATA